MKIRLTFKTPDVIDTVMTEYPVEDIRDEVQAAIRKWVRHDEYITVEIDTQAGTCVVMPVA
jgi:hypothetical protein